MIQSSTGERRAPKQKAQELLMYQVTNVMYRLYEDEPELTDRERELVAAQIIKQKERVERLLGFEPGSWSFG